MSSIYTPAKRVYSANDPFFHDGNVLLRGFWLKKQATTEKEVQLIQQETKTVLSAQKPIYCKPCHIQLPNVMAYEKHYEAKHTHVCLTCRKIFPGSAWLQLHLNEMHDPIMLVRKERGEKIHACYVETCSKCFSTPKTRRLHLIQKHQYPKHFPFDLVYTGSLNFHQLKKRDKKNKERMKRAGRKDGDVEMRESTKAPQVRVKLNKKKEDEEMNELVEAFDKKINIPKSITFGRQPNRALLRRKNKDRDTMDVS